MYRIYSRISRGFLDSFLIRKLEGRQIKVYNMKHNLEYQVKHKTKLLKNLVTINSCLQFVLTLISYIYFDHMYHVQFN